MTREETLRWLNNLIEGRKDPRGDNEIDTALKEAVKIIEKEPCEDAISRQQVKSDYADWFGYGYRYNWFYEHLSNIPPVNPQEPKTIQEKQAESEKYQKAFDDGYANGYSQARFDYEPKTGHWIPVSERLPEVDERVLVTRRMFHWANEPIEYTVGIESFSGNIDFVAWMPFLLKPYKAEGSENEK